VRNTIVSLFSSSPPVRKYNLHVHLYFHLHIHIHFHIPCTTYGISKASDDRYVRNTTVSLFSPSPHLRKYNLHIHLQLQICLHIHSHIPCTSTLAPMASARQEAIDACAAPPPPSFPPPLPPSPAVSARSASCAALTMAVTSDWFGVEGLGFRV